MLSWKLIFDSALSSFDVRQAIVILCANSYFSIVLRSMKLEVSFNKDSHRNRWETLVTNWVSLPFGQTSWYKEMFYCCLYFGWNYHQLSVPYQDATPSTFVILLPHKIQWNPWVFSQLPICHMISLLWFCSCYGTLNKFSVLVPRGTN